MSRDSNAVNSLIHLYRGELGRMVSYRLRLDITTNWSILTTAAIATLALGDPTIPHVVFLFAMFLNFFFLKLESRRFRVFELSHKRVRLLEKYFYDEMLSDVELPDWRQRLVEELRVPRSPVSPLDSLGWRLRRNYLWLYGALLLLWGIKLDFVEGRAAPLNDLVQAAAIGVAPGWLVLALVLFFYVLMIGLAVQASVRYRPDSD